MKKTTRKNSEIVAQTHKFSYAERETDRA